MEGKGGTLSLWPVTGTAYRLDQGLAARSVPSARNGSIPAPAGAPVSRAGVAPLPRLLLHIVLHIDGSGLRPGVEFVG
jgi:hypothetical protein